MNEQLLLSNVRSVLIRLEETIIFALIERAQFRLNPIVYEAGAFGDTTEGESLVGYVLRETEKVQARIRRYTSPDEFPFFDHLPEPILPPLRYGENPLRRNQINVNARIRRVYEKEIVPCICGAGDDGQYGSSSVCDVNCLQALSKRIHYGKFVAESKCQTDPDCYHPLIGSQDREGLLQAITNEEIEAKVLERVRLKARTHGQDIGGDATQSKIDPGRVVEVYSRWIIQLTKDVEVEYLLARGPDEG